MRDKEHTPGNSFGELIQFNEGERGTYVPVEMARVSGVRFVWRCTIGQDRGLGRYFICILREVGTVEGETL